MIEGWACRFEEPTRMLRKRIGYADDVAGFIRYSHEDSAARSVCERDQRADDTIRRGEIPLEFEGLSLRPSQEIV
jgi:hypothetical protein